MNGFEWAVVLMVMNTPGSPGQWDEIQGRALWDTGYRTETFHECTYGHFGGRFQFCRDDVKTPIPEYMGGQMKAGNRISECEFWMGRMKRVCLPVRKGFNLLENSND